MNEKNRTYLQLLAFVALLTGATMVGTDAWKQWKTGTSETVSTADIVQSSVIPEVAEALQSRAQLQEIVFPKRYSCPFRPSSERRVIRTKKVSIPKGAREKLKLKGFLLKDKPLAILENNFGQTFICGVGEQAGEQTVVKISREEVVVKDEHGTYSLSVGE